jgi:Flp pilus assembly protein TadG
MRARNVCVFELILRFRRHADGSIAPLFALALIPVITAVGAAVDYSRANNFRSFLQAALDTSLLAGAKDGTSNWAQVAADVFHANVSTKTSMFSLSSPSFTQTSAATFKASVSALFPTSMLAMIQIPALRVSVTAAATASEPDNSCILTLDRGQSASHVSLSLNGAPIVNLSGCSIRSNTSLDCNGHDGDATKAIAGGLASGCGRPTSNVGTVPDIYASLASNISTQCGDTRTGVTWIPGTIPIGTGIKTVSNGGRTEYHICGDLTLSGSGYLTGSAPGSDALIVIENGSLIMENNASVSVARTAIIMTGNNNYPMSVNFPNGNGKQATLTLSPPLEPTNPWQGVALYQDPKLTNNVDNRWGPGANFNADGLVYLSNSNVVTDGNTASSNAKCSKFVMNSFVTNGSVNLDFDQSVASCTAIGLKQWAGITVRLTN